MKIRFIDKKTDTTFNINDKDFYKEIFEKVKTEQINELVKSGKNATTNN